MPNSNSLDYFKPSGEPLRRLDGASTQSAGPVPVFRSVGAYGFGTTSCVAAVPTGGAAPQANDILVIVVESTDSTTAAGTPNTPSGWTKLFEETQGDGATGVTTLTVFGKRAGAGETDVTIDGVGNHCSASMYVVEGCITTGDAWTVGAGNGANSGNGTLLGVTTPSDNCLVLALCGTTRDANSSATFSAWTNANLANLTERGDNTRNTGAGGGHGIAMGEKTTAGDTGSTTVTISVSQQWRGVQIALRPPEVTQTQAPRSAHQYRLRRR